MQCPNCQNTVPDSANVCGYCGTRLRVPALPRTPQFQAIEKEKPPPQVSRSKGLSRWIWILLGIGASITIIGIGLFNFVESGKETIAIPTQDVKPDDPGQGSSVLSIEPYQNSDYPPFSSFTTNFSNDYDASKRSTPGSFTWFMEIQRNQPAQIYLYNCASKMEILNDIYRHISYTLVVDERIVNNDDLFFVEADPARGEFCHIRVGLIREWPGPQHTIVITMRLDQTINDGWMNHSAGDYTDIYQVNVIP